MKPTFFLSQLLLVALVSTRVTFAATSAGGQAAREFVAKINEVILYPLIILMMAIALLVFLYGSFEYIWGSDNDGARDTGRRHMLWGVIGLLVMVSAVAILTIAAGTFGLGSELDDALLTP